MILRLNYRFPDCKCRENLILIERRHKNPRPECIAMQTSMKIECIDNRSKNVIIIAIILSNILCIHALFCVIIPVQYCSSIFVCMYNNYVYKLKQTVTKRRITTKHCHSYPSFILLLVKDRINTWCKRYVPWQGRPPVWSTTAGIYLQ